VTDRLGPTHDQAVKRLDRLADRLRVVGPRLAGRSGAEAAATLVQIRAGLQHLADLTADADGEPRRPVPELAAYALADQALVLGHDLLGRDAGARTDIFRITAVQALDDVIALLG
jgi:hypothetical protein